MTQVTDRTFPLRHLSIRVPWHDAGWTGVVCKAPHLNGACAQLKRIADKKDDVAERAVAGLSLEELPQAQWPCCVEERATFMAPFPMEQIKSHALAYLDNYRHFQPTRQYYPPYSAGIVPFRWMMGDNMDGYRDLYDLDIDLGREPDLGYKSSWLHEVRNQKTLLDAFAGHLREEQSLTLFYAKHVPFVEGTGRILIGAGRIIEIGQVIEYDRQGEGMRGMVWERPIQHSIRPMNGDGFLMPYYEILEQATTDPSLDVERYVAKAPDEHWDEFSFGSELVSHDGAIGALLSLDTALVRIEEELGIATGWQRAWVHTELVRLWKVRGPFPGLGAVLSAMGLSRGVFVAHALQNKAGENEDPWPLVDKAFTDPGSVLPAALHRDLREIGLTWTRLSEERKAFLRLLSRFELSKPQADILYEARAREKQGWGGTDREIIQDPYRIYELSRHDPEGVRLLLIDRGVFPEDVVRNKHPLPAPSGLESAVDLRRVRAFTIAALEEAAESGHTLLPVDHVVDSVLRRAARPQCQVTGDLLITRIADMGPDVVAASTGDDMAFQLARYQDIGQTVRKQVNGRVGGKRHEINYDWAAQLAARWGPATDDEEKRARAEKTAALKELAESRFSVLAGPAGAGKTSVLGFLCAHPDIRKEGLLLLAPTGKARVRMQELAEDSQVRAFTIAQFLNQNGRYDGRTGRYMISERPKAGGYGTVIVDEASMLTEDMLGALFDALSGVKRFILVGDPSQLPPIGAGRPFVDIIVQLRPEDYETRFPRVAAGYAELTIERRQMGNERPDLRLARWFGHTPPQAGDDDVFSAGADEHATVRFVEWRQPEDFHEALLDVLVEELKLAGRDDIRGFNLSLGATVSGDFEYFNASRNGEKGSVAAIENWQILSPLRGMPFGINDINRQIHERFRASYLDLATRTWRRPIPKALGAERIVYGDKVINLNNHRRDSFPQHGGLDYLANGELGIAVGQWKSKGKSPYYLNVEFSSQQGASYGFSKKDFAEEGNTALELAYGLTVHKAQGSQFKLVILVVPEGHPILSRELIYTALTRHEDRVVVMHQGPRTLLKELAAPHHSDTARRMTNLLQPCRMLEFPQAKGSLFLQEGLIHRTSTGIAVRSKSELIIYEALRQAGYLPEYEKSLTLGGRTRYPDFTIEDDISGLTIYWEHLGLLDRPKYRRRWEAKLAWYKANGILPAEEGGGPEGTLITTTESTAGGFDFTTVQDAIRNHLNG